MSGQRDLRFVFTLCNLTSIFMSLRRIIVPRHLTLDYLEGIMDCTLKNIGKFFFVIITTTPRILEKHIVINF